MALASFWLVRKGLNVDVAMRFEVQVAFLLLALSLPPTILVMAPIGMLVAHQRFDLINKVRIPMTLLVYVGPAAISFFTPNLAVIIGFMAGTRFVNLFVFTLIFKKLRLVQEVPLLDWKLVSPLLRYGGWMTVVHMISPLMLSLDRFMIAVLISASSVAYYAAPSEALVRLWSIPGAIVGVLFPALAALIVSDCERTKDLFDLGVKSIYILMFPVTLGVVLFAPEVLQAWLGHDYHVRSTAVMQIIAVGVYVYSINHMPAELINAAGRPRFTAVVRLLELPPYLLLTWWLILEYGIEGAAASWLIRIVIDTFVLFIASDRILQGSWRTRPGMLLATGTGAAFLFLGIAIGSPLLGVAAPISVRLAYSLISLVVVSYVFFVTWVDREERAFLACLLRRNLLWKTSN
jgi:O-antigen/teichoic acid export membrane protein